MGKISVSGLVAIKGTVGSAALAVEGSWFGTSALVAASAMIGSLALAFFSLYLFNCCFSRGSPEKVAVDSVRKSLENEPKGDKDYESIVEGIQHHT